MTQGNIANWRKKEGDEVAAGHILAEVETDKATIEWESQEEGFIAKLLVPTGAKEIPVGTPVAIIVEDKAAVGAFKDYTPSGSASSSASSAAAPPPPTPTPVAAGASAGSQSFPPHQVMAMPALSPTMTMGNILDWKKKVGDAVASGEVYVEVETDKATVSWESQEDGFLAQILLPSNSKEVPVGTPAFIMVEDKDSIPAFANYTSAAASSPAKAAPAAAPAAAPTVAAAAPPPPAPAAPRAAVASDPSGRVVASPYAKKLAAEAGVSLAGVSGSGPGGRVVAADVQAALKSGQARPAGAAGAAAGVAAPLGAFTDISMSNIRQVTAERLLMSKQTIPHYYLTMEVTVDKLLELREVINKQLAANNVKISVNDVIVKAAAMALKQVPAVNSSWQGSFIRQYNNVDINVAVQTPVGLMVPFVAAADQKSLRAISSDIKTLAGKAREGKLQPSEFQGGTFTISNLGMYGIKQFAAIVNPPQAAILAVGSLDKKVVQAADGKFGEATTMLVTLSCDHRVVDGAIGAEWLNAFKSYMENPLTLLV